jgi:hypothetical protein
MLFEKRTIIQSKVESYGYCGSQDVPDGAATTYHNDTGTCPRPSYMDESTHRAK